MSARETIDARDLPGLVEAGAEVWADEGRITAGFVAHDGQVCLTITPPWSGAEPEDRWYDADAWLRVVVVHATP